MMSMDIHDVHFLPTPSLLAGRGDGGSPDAVSALLSNRQNKTNALLATSAEHTTMWAAAGKVNSIPSKPSTTEPPVVVLLRWAAELHTTTLSLPLLKGKWGENMMKGAQGLR